jgi:hypothetical protein
MNIQSATWSSEAQTTARVTTDNGEMFVPADAANIDWQRVQEWIAEGNVIADYVPGPKYPDAAAAKAAMVEWIAGFTATVTGPVPVDERLSWDAKEQAARAYVAETADAAQTSMIEDEAAITGEVPADLAAIIIAKADTFRAVVARVAGLRRKTIAAIDAVTDPADYETVLVSAKAEAEAMAAALGITVPGGT